MAVSYRQLNQVTKPFRHPIHHCDDAVHDLGDAKFFISMDLDSGYHQIEVHPESRQKLAFFAPDGKYHFKCMPFGPVNSAPVFVAMMEDLAQEWNKLAQNLSAGESVGMLSITQEHVNFLRHHRGSKVIVDDMLLYASSILALLLYLCCVLQVLLHYRASVKLKKCQFFSLSLEFVGINISAIGNQPAPSKFSTFKQLRTPQTTGDLRTLMGLFSFYSKFLEYFEVRIGIWRDLIKQIEASSKETDQPIPTPLWTQACQQLLEQLQQEILDGPLLL